MIVYKKNVIKYQWLLMLYGLLETDISMEAQGQGPLFIVHFPTEDCQYFSKVTREVNRVF